MTEIDNDLKRIFGEFNDTETEFPGEKTLHRLFEEQVGKNPGSVAVIFKNETMTYEQLEKKANSLARLLHGKQEKKGDRREKGDRQEKIVAVMVERSFEMMIALLAILKAGGAYLPISPSNPPKRIEYILNDSQAPVLLVQGNQYKKMQDRLGNDATVQLINLDAEDTYQLSHELLNLDVSPRNLAYIIYTSGSTGKPKGVMIEHRSVINRLHWMQKKYPLDHTSTLIQKTPYFFDVSVWELFWWFFAGARVCFLHPGVEKFPQFIVETVEKWNVTEIHFVPSMLSPFLQYVQNDEAVIKRLNSLKRVFTSGESLSPSHVRMFNDTLYRVNSTQLTNLYGPTEATVDVTYFDCPPGENPVKIPIGKPIDNTKVLILDNENKPVPIGKEGEIVLAGTGIARGYLNNVAMTSGRFFATDGHRPPAQTFTDGFVLKGDGEPSFFINHQSSIINFYFTGDIGRWLADGNIEYLGRRDHQVKIRGLRIELGEIEAAVANRSDVRDCVVLVKEYSSSIILIVAYVVTADVGVLTEKELKNDLKDILPDYMVPNRFVFIDDFPLTPSGKVDRRALPEPEFK